MTYEEVSRLADKTLDFHRAIDSLREEMEAVDLYNQRADACTNPDLKKILLHNAKEEKEHAIMLIEWIRRNDDELDHEVKDYINSEGPIGH